jgi:hypothetical protein
MVTITVDWKNHVKSNLQILHFKLKHVEAKANENCVRGSCSKQKHVLGA